MNKKFTKLIAALALLVFMTPSLAGWGQTRTDYVLNGNNFDNINGGSGYAAYDGNHTINGIGITSKDVMTSSQNLQIKKSSGYLYNNTEMPGDITKITLSSTTNLAIYVSTTANTETTSVTSDSTISGSYKYFKVKSTGGAAAYTTITVTYSSGSATYSVTYKANGGTGDNLVDGGYASGATVTVKANDGTGNPNFTKTGHDFEKWNTKADGTGTNYTAGNIFNISGNTDLYAQWTKNNYNVAVSSINGVTLTATYGANTITDGNSANVPYGTAVTLAAGDLGEGQVFVWNITKTSGGEDVTSAVLSGTTLTVPDYNITIGGTISTLYTVTYDCNDGDSGCPENVTGIVPGTSITLAAAPTKEGNIFMGWKVGTSKYAAGASYQVNSNVTFTAQWKVGATCKVNFGSSSGYFNLSNTTNYTDGLENTWSASPSWVGNSAYNAQSNYVQVGTSDNKLNSISFTTTLSNSVQIIALSAKIGGYSGTAGTIDLQVGGNSIGSASLNGTSDITATNTSAALGTELTVSIGDQVQRIKCYYIEYTYVEIGTDPIINATNVVNLSSTDTNNEFAFEIVNPVSGKSLTASSTTEWISNVAVDSDNGKVTFTTTENESTTTNRSGSITLSYEGADDLVVTINQSKVDYVTLPFTFTGDASGTNVGFETNGLGTYSSTDTPIKFDDQGDYLIIKFREAPASVSYSVKVNGTYGNTNVFNVQTSDDKETWTTVASHTTMSSTTATFTCLNLEGKYVKWVYTTRTGGNVGLGNLKASTQYDIYGIVTVASLTPTVEKKCTIYSGGVLSVTSTWSNTTAANLIIKDGGQLITNSENVQATVQKTIAARSTENDVNKGWAFVASPIATDVAPTSVSNMTGTDFDLYRFNQSADLEWENWKKTGNHFQFNLVNGQGYLYNNVSTKTLEFAGAIKSSNTPISVAIDSVAGKEFAGWNLVGNPFTFNAYVNRSYYKMNDDGSAILAEVQVSGSTIAPCTGIMVKATAETGQSVTFSKEPIVNAPSNGNVSIAVVQVNERGASTTTIDNAIVSFNEGNELPKFYFGNANANLYIPQGEKEYAIATSEGQGEMPLNFRANADGQYTLTVNPEGVEMNYLHLVDNMTGNDVDLLATPSYTFNATTRDYESRFRLVFAANNESGVSAGSTTFAFYSNGNWMVNNEGEATLQVIDVMGRVLSNQTISGTAELSLNQQPGVYVLRLVNGNDVKTQKIVVR